MRTACFALIDSGVDAGYAAFERAASRQAAAATRAVPADAPPRTRRRTLSELPSAPGARETSAPAADAAATATVSVPAAAPSDAEASLQHLRFALLGLAAVVALVLLALCLRAARR